MSTKPKLTLMAVFAHPDDESFGIGGTLARYGADPDVRVVLVCATRGEAGEISDPELATPERLGDVRERELRCACQVLEIDALHLLGYRDSGMAGTPENRDPRSLAMADADKVVGKVVAHIRLERPDVVVTFDEMGGYGHPDHIAIHHHAAAAFCRGRRSHQISGTDRGWPARPSGRKAVLYRHSPAILPRRGRKDDRDGPGDPSAIFGSPGGADRPARRGLHHRCQCAGFLGHKASGCAMSRHPA
jgi:LmbE family N-acetylglucosaminyl deacetylase